MPDTTPAEPRDYSKLPEPIRLEDTIATRDPSPPPEPNGDQDPERNFMLRYAG